MIVVDEFIGARMIKVSGSGGTGGARRTGGVTAARGDKAGSFKVDGAAGAAPAAGAPEIASASALGALISLQSEGRSRARNRAAAERALMLPERVRDGLMEGRIARSDLAALADAADAKLDDPDERIAGVYAEIALRAKVELAKLAR
jgi:hypothetical protein